MQPETKSQLILAWSLPLEPGFVDAARSLSPAIKICPLRYESLRTARKLFEAHEILIPADLVSHDMLVKFDEMVIDGENRLRKYLKKHSPPSLNSLCYQIVRRTCFAAFHVWGIMDALPRHGDLAKALYYPFFSHLNQPPHLRAEEALFSQSLAVAQRLKNQKTQPFSFQMMKEACQRGLGRIMNRHPRAFFRRLKRLSVDEKSVDILVVGLFKTDRMAQQTLVQRLREEKIGEIAWCHYTGDTYLVAVDETAQPLYSRQEGIDEHDCLDFFQWRFAFFSRCSNGALAQQLAEGLCHAFADDLSMERALMLARAILMLHPPLVPKYTSIAAMLSKFQPRMIVADCNCQVMAFAREWARNSHVPYLKLPHGFEYECTTDYEWDNNATGICGRWLADRVRCRSIVHNQLFVAGGAHMSEQALRLSLMPTPLQTRQRVCLLATDVGQQDFPDTEEERINDLEHLAQTVAPIGLHLSIRCHPRTHRLWFYRLAVDEISKRGSEVELLDSQLSLWSQLGESIAAIMRLTSSSAIIALYAQVPLIGWLPRPGPADSDLFLNGLPLHAHTAEEIEALLRRLRLDASFRKYVIEQQSAYLEQLVENPYGDPYQRSIEVIKRFAAQHNT